MNCKQLLLAGSLLLSCPTIHAIDNPDITSDLLSADNFTLVSDGIPAAIYFDSDDDKGISRAVENLARDFHAVTGRRPAMLAAPKGKNVIIVGSLRNPMIDSLCKRGMIDRSQLEGATEKYLMTTVENPLPGVDEALVIAGSDRRGTIYGIYELSEQLGVSPWYWWADVPVIHRDNLSIKKGRYTAGEPAVRYRGLFLNDEAPCLTGWVKDYFGTDYGGVEFYEKVFELLLRLRGNYLWPAMWGWSFYADDPRNSDLADEMDIIMGTSHHEPMARNHQEWARHRNEYGAWDYASNKAVIDDFFRQGVRRIADKEDIITIGMRGDGDAPMGGEEGKDHEYKSRDLENLRLLTSVIDNQRKIIRKETGQSPDKHPQLWALYKEVQKYYDMGLRVPDDVIILLADDNWGNIRKVPTEAERGRKGGWGMYYHVDYVGAPRNSKWLNVTPVQNMWEQLDLTYEYGIDR
ncbi:MAG: glycosyl hydrolase 115 family protein, partial [Muribaculaceae bacterium]|nr:glycosyl hydrolase 115 family protein [Muribaculaceae bacterium]